MYQLYINEQTLELKVGKLKNQFLNETKVVGFLKDEPSEIYYYNDNYRLCGKRAPLVELARVIKNGWLAQAKSAVQKIEEIKI
jgi:hypothetical protein